MSNPNDPTYMRPATQATVRQTAAFNGGMIASAAANPNPVYAKAGNEVHKVREGTPCFMGRKTNARRSIAFTRNSNIDVISALNGQGDFSAGREALRSELSFAGVAAVNSDYAPDKNVGPGTFALTNFGVVSVVVDAAVRQGQLAICDLPEPSAVEPGAPVYGVFRAFNLDTDSVSRQRLAHFRDFYQGTVLKRPDGLQQANNIMQSVREIMAMGALIALTDARGEGKVGGLYARIDDRDIEKYLRLFGAAPDSMGKSSSPMVEGMIMSMLAPNSADSQFQGAPKRSSRETLNYIVRNSLYRLLVGGVLLDKIWGLRVCGKFLSDGPAGNRSDLLLHRAFQ